ncbi:unnamed protein product [Closterium sp. NIES-53]
MNGRFLAGYSSAPASPQLFRNTPSPSSSDGDHQYLADLLAERKKLLPFRQVLPHCGRLLDQEIARLSSIVGSPTYMDHEHADTSSPISHPIFSPGPSPFDAQTWSPMPNEVGPSTLFATPTTHQPTTTTLVGWTPQPGAAPILKKARRIDVPVDQYPTFNFVGRILGPRGNSLKRVEAQTGCRVLIRGRGSIKDPTKEEKMRNKPGYEHLNEPLHVIVEAELPANIVDAQLSQACEILEELLKPVDESCDILKRAQLRELAIINGTLREDTGSHSLFAGAPSPFSDPEFRSSKTRR